jgi:serine/threonine-protein kinase HipA
VLVVDRFDRRRRIAFSRLISNTDDHLRNHGFLRASTGGWSLSPAFDLNPNPEVGAKRFSTPIDDSGDDRVETMLVVAELFRLSPAEASSVLAEVSHATGRWREVARRLGLKTGAIAEMEPAFEHPAADEARQIGAAPR